MPAWFADNSRSDSLATRFRRNRFRLFLQLLGRIPRPASILDVGGSEAFWNMTGNAVPDDVSITLLNLDPATVASGRIRSVVGDARHMDFPDRSFDVAFSNSVIEHVGSLQAQGLMACEVRRVARRYFVQTPNRSFPLEPHFLFPFFQFLPMSSRTWLLQNFNLGWYRRTEDPKLAHQRVESVRLLDRRQLLALFPGAEIYAERVLGFVKSYVVYHGWDIGEP